MCCLGYENDYYAQVNKKMPKLGSTVKLSDGREGVAVSVNQLKETVRVKFENGENVEFDDVSADKIQKKGAPAAAEEPDAEKIDEELKDLLD